MKFGLTQYTLDQFAQQVVDTYTDRPALGLFGQEAITFREMGEKMEDIRRFLLENGLGRGDKIAIVAPTTPKTAISYLSVMTLGAVAAPIMEDFPNEDITSIINWIEAKALLTTRKIYQSLKDSIKTKLTLVWDIEEEVILDQRRAPAREPEPIQEEDLAEILFTSGTTGHSKGVMLTHKNLVSNLFEGPDMIGCIHDRSVTLSLLPMAHAYGSTSGFLAIIYKGSALYFLGRKPSPALLLKALKTIRPTVLGGVPLIFEKIYARKIVPVLEKNAFLRFLSHRGPTKRLLYRIMGRQVRKSFGDNLDVAIVGGAPLSEEVEIFLRMAKIPTVLGYGMTETSPLITFGSPETAKQGSVGQAIGDTEIRIVKPDPESGIGEVWVRGPGVMKGYYDNPEETAAMFSEDGYLITGDLGYLDDEGYLFLKGRSKNVILGPAGENIYPEVVESVIAQYPEVDEVLVLMEENQLTARIYPSPEILEELEREGDAKRKDWEKHLDQIRGEVNQQLPGYSRLNRFILQEEPFEMTVTNKIKRSAYYYR